MSSTSTVQSIVEPTPAQLTQLKSLLLEAATLRLSLAKTVRELQDLEKSGLVGAGRGARSFVDNRVDSSLRQFVEDLEDLLTSRANPYIQDWLFRRVRLGQQLREALDDDDLRSIEGIVATEKAVTQRDPELINALNAGTASAVIGDPEEVVGRAGEVLETLLESGWRP